jgi:hypothetical protein
MGTPKFEGVLALQLPRVLERTKYESNEKVFCRQIVVASLNLSEGRNLSLTINDEV